MTAIVGWASLPVQASYACLDTGLVPCLVPWMGIPTLFCLQALLWPTVALPNGKQKRTYVLFCDILIKADRLGKASIVNGEGSSRSAGSDRSIRFLTPNAIVGAMHVTKTKTPLRRRRRIAFRQPGAPSHSYGEGMGKIRLHPSTLTTNSGPDDIATPLLGKGAVATRASTG